MKHLSRVQPILFIHARGPAPLAVALGLVLAHARIECSGAEAPPSNQATQVISDRQTLLEKINVDAARRIELTIDAAMLNLANRVRDPHP